ncbi:MAG TPA: hypothetical protein VM434_08795 [Beijerinckiaceae bacterium]|nr:hypothetical protein [Beijerinckiaceae bacterium]
MNFFSKVTEWFRGGGGGAPQDRAESRPEGEKSDLQKNMEKALQMKQEAGPQTSIPEHRTAHEGGVGEPQMGMTDREAGSEGSYTPQLKRSRVARSGDTGTPG